jgi:hypothetical protein
VAVEIGGVPLQHLVAVATRERLRVARLEVPGMAGDLVQVLGRQGVELELRGSCLGPRAAEDVAQLRRSHVAQQPVDLLADILGEAYVERVLVTELEVQESAGAPDEFAVRCRLVEWVEPPAPAVAALPGIDTAVVDEAAGLVDQAQDAMAQVGELTALVGAVPDFGDPTTRLRSMLTDYQQAGSGAVALLARLHESV